MIEPLNALLESMRAGSGALVVVEGETKNDDPWVYNLWFGARGRELTFVHQDGYRQVQAAVAYLREHAPGRPVFGLIDRDDTTRDETDVDEALGQGVFRTGWYTLENYYFADITAWMQVVEELIEDAPEGWRTETDIEARVVGAYRKSLPVAAWNRVVRDECRRAAGAGKSLGYREHPEAISEEGLQKLLQWGHARGAPRSLHDCYTARLQALMAMPTGAWPEYVTGKAVLSIFTQEFPALHGAKDKADVLRRRYMKRQAAPPPDLAAIVELMLGEAERMRRRTPSPR